MHYQGYAKLVVEFDSLVNPDDIKTALNDTSGGKTSLRENMKNAWRNALLKVIGGADLKITHYHLHVIDDKGISFNWDDGNPVDEVEPK